MNNEIIRGTSPTIRAYMTDTNGENINLSNYDEVWIMLKNGSTTIKIEKDDITFRADRMLEASLTQSQTLSLNPLDNLEVQIRAIKDGKAIASNITMVNCSDVLIGGTIQ